MGYGSTVAASIAAMATAPPTKAARFVRGLVLDGSLLMGAGLAIYGSLLAFRPAGFIVAGLLLLALGATGARR
jgi:hypothetical protein